MYNQGKIMRRLLGRSAADASSNDSNLAASGFPTAAAATAYRPNASQDAEYQADVPIACVDKSADGQIAVLGGRHILKTVHFDGLDVKEGIDVRALITNQISSKGNASISDQLSIKDVKLAPDHVNDPRIYTACGSGRIFMYDINHLGSSTTGLEYIQTREDTRQINKLDFNPYKATWLLSGGQDGVVRCFDVRAPVTGRNGLTFRTFQAYRCNADGIRDLKWSPKDGFIFACATESGFVMKWDIKKNNAPLLKINAHDPQKGASSISWHPDGEHLMSGGFDSKCHVWDLSGKAEKRQKPKWTIHAPAPVSTISWRPGLWSATAQGKRAAQVAVSYDDGGNNKRHGVNCVHIWDLARPTMPYKEVDQFGTCPNALLWHDQDLLWTAGQDGLFRQCDIAFAPKVIDRQPLSSLKFSARGDVLMFLEERPMPPRPRPIVAHSKVPSSYSSSPSGQMLSISRSDSEEDVIGSFLGPKRRPSKKRQAGSRSGQALSTTPPSGTNMEDHVISLEQAIKLTGPFRPQQVMAIGHVPAAPTVHIYHHLSSHYLEILQRELPRSGEKNLSDRVAYIMEQYARAAEDVTQFRLAQTWRILSYTTNLLLKGRSQFHLEKRLTRGSKKSPTTKDRPNLRSTPEKRVVSPYIPVTSSETSKKTSSLSSMDGRQTHGRSLLAEEIDSDSNVPTPLARPVKENGAHGINIPTHTLTPVQEIGSFSLPPSVHADKAPSPRKRLDSNPISVVSQDSHLSSTEGYDFFDVEAAEALTRAIDVPQKRQLRSTEFAEANTAGRRKSVGRHDSGDSFTQIFSLSDSSRQASYLTSSSDTSGRQMTRRHQLSRNNSDAIEEEEYESRIRGHQLGESPEQTRFPLTLERKNSDSLRDDYMISQATTDTFDSESSRAYNDRSPLRLEQAPPPFPDINTQEVAVSQRPEEHTSPTITETDYLPWPDDPQYPYPLLSDTKSKPITPPIDPYDVVSKALAFETRHSALNASAIILLLKPLVPDGIIDDHQASAVLRQHHNRLMGMGLFIEAALLRKLCVRGWPGDAMDYWGENYSTVFGPAQERQRVSVAFACARCHKPRGDIDRAAAASGDGPGVWRCESCRAAVAPCAVCGHRDLPPSLLGSAPLSTIAEGLAAANVNVNASPLDSADAGDDLILATWWYCPGCSHGGHASCLEGWHAPVSTTSASTSTSTTPPTNYPKSRPHPGHHPSQFSAQQHHHTSYQDYTNPASAAASRPPSPPDPAFPQLLPDIDLTPYPDTYSGGCCPLDGCGHACLPGRWRDETAAARTEELGRAVRDQTRGSGVGVGVGKSPAPGSGGVGAAAARERRVSAAAAIDAFDVPQSRAVEHVRELSLSGLNIGGGDGFGHVVDRDRDRDRDREPQRPNTTTGAGLFSGFLGTSPGRVAEVSVGGGGGSGGSTNGNGNGNGNGIGNGNGKASVEKERRKSVKFAGATMN